MFAPSVPDRETRADSRGGARASAGAYLSAARLTPLDAAFIGLLALLAGCHVLAAAFALGWPSAAATDALAMLYLAVLMARPAWRPLVGRLVVLGLVAGVVELATDFAGERVAHSLMYPATEPLLWGSPYYMPLSWAIVLTQLGYLAWRLRHLDAPRVPLGLVVALTGLAGAALVPFYEEMAYYARWWHYAPAWRLGHTPVYVIVFEGAVAAALPLLTRGLLRRPLRSAAALGLVVGAWMPAAAFVAWFAVGR
ncbi:MAG: DUF6989 domain-containing protein [Ktedonobacterales bacterium]